MNQLIYHQLWKISQFDVGNAVLFQIKFFGGKTKENTPAKYFGKITVRPSFQSLRVITFFSSMDYLICLYVLFFDAISSNVDEVSSINPSNNAFVFGDCNVHHNDQLIYSGGTDRLGELCYNFSIFICNYIQFYNFYNFLKLPKMLRRVRLSLTNQGQWRRKCSVDSTLFPQLHSRCKVSWKPCLNLCSFK